MKRILSLVLSAAIIFSLFGGVTASANEEAEKSQWKVTSIRDKDMSLPRIEVWRDGISFMY